MLDGLTVVRFVAALWVFLFHFDLRIQFPLPAPAARIISNGALAMPIFFMLSGFVLAHRYQDKYENFNKFFRARVARIYPAYILSVIASIPFALAPKGSDLATLLFVLPVDLLVLQAWYPNLYGYLHHAGTWSISVEFFLYASFPLLLPLAKLSTRNLFLVCMGCVLLSASFIPSLRVGASAEMPFPVFYSIPIFSLPAFIIGVALAEFRRRGYQGSWTAPVLLALVLAFAGQYNFRFAGLNIVTIPLIAVSLLFAAQLSERERFSGFMVNKYFVYLGNISYAFFVFQMPLLMILEYNLQTARSMPGLVVFCLMLGANLALAAISHRWLEPWGRRLILRHWKA